MKAEGQCRLLVPASFIPRHLLYDLRPGCLVAYSTKCQDLLQVSMRTFGRWGMLAKWEQVTPILQGGGKGGRSGWFVSSLVCELALNTSPCEPTQDFSFCNCFPGPWEGGFEAAVCCAMPY